MGTFNPSRIQALSLITAGNGAITADSITVGTLGISSGGTVSFTEVGGLQNNTIQNLGSVSVTTGDFDFQNRAGLNLTGTTAMSGRLSLEVAGQFNNQTGVESPLANVAGGSVIKSLSLVGGLPNTVSGLAGFSYRYDGVMPTSGNVMSFAWLKGMPPESVLAQYWKDPVSISLKMIHRSAPKTLCRTKTRRTVKFPKPVVILGFKKSRPSVQAPRCTPPKPRIHSSQKAQMG